MICKTFVFSKIQKTISKIEGDINEFLKDHEFKYATQNESATKGKFIVSLFAEEKKSSIRVKVFKDQQPQDVDKKVNEFLQSCKMKFVTQTFVGSSVYTVIFYDSKKSADNNQDESNGTN